VRKSIPAKDLRKLLTEDKPCAYSLLIDIVLAVFIILPKALLRFFIFLGSILFRLFKLLIISLRLVMLLLLLLWFCWFFEICDVPNKSSIILS
jgi:hypothetical protein